MPDTIDRFLPEWDIAEDHATVVRAPADLVFRTAEEFDMQSIPLVNALFRMRGAILRSEAAPAPRQGLVRMTRSLGWGELARTPGRELVCGAVTRPWERDVVFRAIPAPTFAAFAEPGLVKIVWTVECEPLYESVTRFRTRTRALATSGDARKRFRGYWRWARLGVIPIRWLLLRAVRRQSERSSVSNPEPSDS